MFYKRIASVVTQEELDRARDEMQDRYGKLPEQGINLLELARLRLLAEKLRVQQVDYRAGALLVKFSDNSPIEPDHVLRYVRRRPDATFSPPGILRLKGALSETARLAATRELLMALA
jgi:transcription-repair coupling factor (superfamily II helicase)